MDNATLISRLLLQSDFERDVVRGVIELDEYRLRTLDARGFKPQTIVDIGGHVGSFVLMANTIWPNAHIVSVEPAHENFTRLHATVGLMPYISLENAAVVGANHRQATATLFRSLDGNTAGGSTVRKNQSDPVTFPAITIIDLIARWRLSRIDLLKLDCEGEEAAILMDLATSGRLRNVKQIAGEWHEYDSIPVIQDALRETHDLELHRGDHPWGAFFARPR